MSPELKAQQLIRAFYDHAKYWNCYLDEPYETDHAKECAKIAANEVIEAITALWGGTKEAAYWQLVKQEIEKL